MGNMNEEPGEPINGVEGLFGLSIFRCINDFGRTVDRFLGNRGHMAKPGAGRRTHSAFRPGGTGWFKQIFCKYSDTGSTDIVMNMVDFETD